MVRAQTAGRPQAETLLRLVCWQNEGEKLAGSPDLLAAFEEANPTLRVNLSYERWPQAHPRLKYWTGSLRNYAPDFTIVKDVWLPQFAGDVIALDEKGLSKELQGLVPATLERCRINGKLMGLPWMASSRVLYCRSDLLEAAKLKAPTTLEELATVAKGLSKDGVHGLGLPASAGGGGVDAYLALLWAMGGQAVADGKVTLKTDEAAKALQYWVELQEAGALQPEGLSWSSAELDGAFAGGKLGMVFSGPALGRYLRRERPALKFETVPLPAGKSQPGQVSVDVLVALKSSKHPEACARFMEYMAAENARRAMWMMGSAPTHRRQVAEAKQDPAQKAFVERLETARGMPMQQTEKVERVVERALWLALSGRLEAAAALRAALAEEEQAPF
ncbi:MAG: extracellular solute-binding protein [Bacteroidota bacterium]